MQQVIRQIRQYAPNDTDDNGNTRSSGILGETSPGSSLGIDRNDDDSELLNAGGTGTAADTSAMTDDLYGMGTDDETGSGDYPDRSYSDAGATGLTADSYVAGSGLSDVSDIDDDDMIGDDDETGTDLISTGVIGSGPTGTVSGTSDLDDDLGTTGSVNDLDIDPDLAQSTQTQPSTGGKSNGKTALVTGASSGIGRELANLFAKDGYNLVLVSRSDDSLQQIAQDYEQQFGIQASVISQDLADPSAPDVIYAETQQQGIQVDVLVNNAGIGEYGKFATESDLEKELDLIQINSVSLVHLTKLYLKDMVARNEGKVLLLGSVASVIPHPMMAVYGATKAFNYSFGEALYNELKDTNITVTVMMPPPTDTDFFNKAGASHTVAQEVAHSMSPADVAKIGYEALMAGKDKVATGLSAKFQVMSGYLLPDTVNTQNLRKLMKDRNEAKEEKKQFTTIALAVGAAVLGGLWLLSRNRTNPVVKAYDKAKYRYKTASAKQTAKNLLHGNGLTSNPLATAVDKAVDTVKDSYDQTKAAVEKVIA